MTPILLDVPQRGARGFRTLTIAVLTAAFLLSALFGANKATAAPGDPFDPLTPYVFVGQDVPTGLFRAVAGAGGSVTFSPEGAPSEVTYNAIGYNTTDDYIYGVVNDGSGSAATPTGSIARIGQDGVVTRVGTSTLPTVALWGAMDGGNNLYVGLPNNAEFRVIDTQTGAVVSTGTLSMPIDVVDVTYAYGYFWGVTSGTGDLVRMDLESAAPTKPVDVFPLGLPTSGHGAAWTFGNGNLGFSHNATGQVTQLEITDPGSASPTATVVATSPGPGSNNNDGAASPGAPTDLSIVKDAPTSYDPGDTIDYSVTVTNDGPGLSTGSVVTDLVPAGLTNVQTSTPGCDEANNQITCTLGQLADGESQTIEYTADSPTSTTACFTNDASVLANESDPAPTNNEASVTSCPRALAVTKTSDATSSTRIGDTVTYTVTATNTGLGDYTLSEPAVVVDDLTGILDDAAYAGDAAANRTGLLDDAEPRISWTGALDDGDSVTIQYSVVTQAGGDGVMRNVAFQPDDPGNLVTPECAPPTSGGLDPVTGEPCAQVVTALPSVSILKTADRSTITTVGETITYSYLITNTGGSTLAPVEVTETAFSGSGGTPVPTCPASASSLAPGASVTCTASYVATQADVNAGEITNTAVATGTPPGGPPVESPPSRVTVETPGPPPFVPPPYPPLLPPPLPPALPSYDLEMKKHATRRRVTVGDTLTYRLLVKNLGPHAAVGVRVTDDVPDHFDVRDASTPQGTCTVRDNAVDCAVGTLESGHSVTVTVRAEAIRAGTAENAAAAIPPPLPPGIPPIDPPGNNTDTATVRISEPRLRVSKRVDDNRLRPGETATYRIRVRNPSRSDVRDVRTCDRLPSGLALVSSRPTAEVSRGRHCWTERRLDAGESVTYRLTVRALSGDAGRKVNRVSATSPDARTGRASRTVRVLDTAVRAGGVTG